MATLSREYRRQLERVIIEARKTGEKGAKNALKALAVEHHEPLSGSSQQQRDLRNRLRAHGRQLGDKLDPKRGTQTIHHLASECTYEQWHRMLFARFLAENDLLIEPESGVALSLEDCRELARERKADWLELASSFAVRMLPQIFRQRDPVLEVPLPPETRKKLEELLESLPTDVFLADDSLGWVYQFWQSEEKDRVNDSGERIGADELPAVTQLFTEDYMVLFLLHNTLGAWWTAKRKAEGLDHALPGYEWTYLRLKEDGSPAAGAFEGWPRSARDLKVLDPCMGSGHFLVFALPILVGFRMVEEGISRDEAVKAVLRDNLFGLELDNRCTQIAAFNIAHAAWRMCGRAADLPQLNLACSGLGINAKEDDWVKLAGEDKRLQDMMGALFRLFQQAPVLGSLIDPLRAAGTLFSTEFTEVEPLLRAALSAEESMDEVHELAVAAQGIVRAATLLAKQFTLLITNVPYLGRAKQASDLVEYCDRFYPVAKADLATCFIERCLQMCKVGGSAAIVVPQNWTFLGRYKQLREKLLHDTTWNFIARLGPSAFQTPMWDFNVMLAGFTQSQPDEQSVFWGLDVCTPRDPEMKAAGLIQEEIIPSLQLHQLKNPDARVVLGTLDHQISPLGTFCDCLQGLRTGDKERFIRFFWEVDYLDPKWEPYKNTFASENPSDGIREAIFWEQGAGSLHRYARESRDKLHDMHESGNKAWGRLGVAIQHMGGLRTSLYFGQKFDGNLNVIVPADPSHLPAIWAYCSSDRFRTDVRRLDQKLSVTNATLVKVPFDLSYWTETASSMFPGGFSKPESEDATQWHFSGTPNASRHQLQVATARLLGYVWPKPSEGSISGGGSLPSEVLNGHVDEDGIVCLSSVKGEAGASNRLLALLADAYGREWSAGKLAELLCSVGYAGRSIEDWLRDGFFEQHCELFEQRPFIWHIWDGLRDGFHALVNYHKLGSPGGLGRQALEKLIYSYLGDWIDRQRADQKNGVDGADARLAAAVHLQAELQKIIVGEPPYDIFVRWKALHEQTIGWEPDINDGVRLNIRPFMMAKALNGRGKASSILRVLPKGIKWDKDRGKEPHRDKEEFPWFWSWDESTQDFAGGREFDGNRWNDLHYSMQAKREARERHKEKASRKAVTK